MKLRFSTGKFKKVLPFLFASLLFFLATPVAQAQDAGRVPSPPTFSSCSDKLRTSVGDRLHLDSGTHSIPGKDDLDGRVDIYTLGQGNFLQCSCPTGGSNGTQSNWWYINGLPMGQVDIDAYERDGWQYEQSGTDWKLLDGPYLAKNSDFTCSNTSLTSTPIPSASPTASNSESSCSSLTVSPKSGTAPLTVKFTASGHDPHGDIQGYEFDFGDSSNNQDRVVTQDGNEATHTYNNSGTYTALLRIKDSSGDMKGAAGTCKKTIVVRSAPSVSGSSDTTQLPETGVPAAVFFGLMIVGEIGYLVYKRFQLV